MKALKLKLKYFLYQAVALTKSTYTDLDYLHWLVDGRCCEFLSDGGW